jgi:hypothetical protein
MTSATPATPPPGSITLLSHCRCIDCRNFSRVGQDYLCAEDIGGTKPAWMTCKPQCDPPPLAWHYCACYQGPRTSKGVWVWPRQAGSDPGVNIPA